MNIVDILYILSTMYNASTSLVTILHHFLEVAIQMFIFGGGIVYSFSPLMTPPLDEEIGAQSICISALFRKRSEGKCIRLLTVDWPGSERG